MKHFFSIVYIMIFSFHFAFSQANENSIENCRKEVRQINTLTFARTIFRYSKITTHDETRFPYYRDVDENMSYIYKDNEGRIRKFITMFNHPEVSGYSIHFFNTEGKVICSYIYNRTYMAPQFYGYRYMEDGEQIFCDMDVYDEERNSWERMSYFDGNMLIAHSNSFDRILHADNVIPFCMSLYERQIDLTDKVQLVIPNIGDKTIINATRVNIRERDDLNSEVILSPLFGEIVEIIEKVREEHIEPYGKNNWYKVAVNEKVGYIFGAFLEPVEQIITE